MSDTVDTCAEGNTYNLRARCFFITTFNEKEFDTLTQLISASDKHALCEEHCPTTGRIHRHAWISFKNARYWKSIKALLPTSNIQKAKGDEQAGLKYCLKEKLISTNIKEDVPIKIISELYDWQKSIEQIVQSQPDDRTIYWIWEPEGNRGKTALIKYLLIKYPFCVFSRATKSADILTIADPKKTCYVLDFARTQESFAPYLALEQLKDGLISDSKLKKESRNIVMNSPHVICFANWPPNTQALSSDRWNIIKI